MSRSHPREPLTTYYGSARLTSGCGSVVLLTGAPGDPIVGFRHVKTPLAEYGPLKLQHDNEHGRLSIYHAVDLVEMLRAASVNGLTAKQATAAMFDTDRPTEGQQTKARRK